MEAQRAAPIALVTAIAVATAIYGMPVDQAVLSAAEGATFGLFPIMWIVVTAIWVYNMTVESGHFAILGRSIASVSQDHRIQAVLIAFCFGTLMEAMAGFGAPAAITAVMMVALGFKPMTAAALALLGNTAAVPFGALGIPITTAVRGHRARQGRSRRDGRASDAVAGPDRPVHPRRHGRRPPRDQAGMARGGGRRTRVRRRAFTCSNHISVELTDIVASISSIAAIVALLQVWAPPRPLSPSPRRRDAASVTPPRRPARVRPYLVVLAVFSIAQLPAVKRELAGSPWTAGFRWPGLDVRSPDGGALPSLRFRLDWLPAAGTLMLISGLIA